ncbi:hypothetical protein ACHQM5_007972 [Ranunculus cassubicifolius]
MEVALSSVKEETKEVIQVEDQKNEIFSDESKESSDETVEDDSSSSSSDPKVLEQGSPDHHHHCIFPLRY